ncbi:MAG: glycosyltransferase family 2 protein [Lentisphaerae bacterium]|nr:glycosyltransferase family 2 protein [Lentisphaerota bacterium]MCP4103768.1 glycosyltransferase family 2 protein [Lentisphaerota bacterium]
MALVSVFIPVYNRELHIAQAIESILEQSFKDFELIIINDGSSDRTEEVILGFESPQIRYYKNEHNLGIPATRNKGLRLARGKYLVLLDSDDIALPNRLQVQVGYMETHPDIVISGTFFKQFGSGSRCRYELFKTDDEIKSFLLWETPFLQPTIIMRLDRIRKSEVWYSEEYNIAEDYDFFDRVGTETGGKFANLKCKLTKYRRHPENITFSKRSAVIARESRKKIRSRRLKALLGEDYSNRYPELVDLICCNKITDFSTLANCFDLLILLEKKNNNLKKYSLFYFNKYIEKKKIFLTTRFFLLLVKNSIKVNLDFISIKRLFRSTLNVVSNPQTTLAKVYLIIKIFQCTFKNALSTIFLVGIFIIKNVLLETIYVRKRTKS